MAKTLIGLVTSAKTDKTITVTVTSRETHPIYKKQYTVSRKYKAHDEKNQANEGDKVMLVESRPISKTKTWKLENIIEKARDTVELREDVIQSLKKEDIK